MISIPTWSKWSFFGSLLLTLMPFSRAQDRSLVQMFPDSTIVFAELAPASEWLNHPLRQQVQKSADFKELWRSDPIMKLRSGLMLAEFALGDTAENLLIKLTAGGLVVSIDKTHQGVALVAKTESKEWLDLYLEKLVKLTRDDAEKKNEIDPVKEHHYREVHAFKFNNGIIAAFDEFLLITNKDTYAKEIADRFLDRSTGGFEQTEQYKRFADGRMRAADTPSAKEIGWLSVDVQTLREAGAAEELLGGKAKDFNAELILGGLLAILHQTPNVSGALRLSDSKISLAISSPYEPQWGGEERVFFFGEDGKGEAMPLLKTDSMIASLSAYRDVSQLWLRAGDLFDESVNDQLAQADNTLTTLFSGRDFGEDILGAIYPEVRIVVSCQEFLETEATPAIRLPEFALVARLRNPDLMKQELKRIFQSLVGFINITGAMNGQPQLDLDIESDAGQQFYTSRFVREVDRKNNVDLPVQFNFGPTIAFVNEFVVLSSTLPLTKQLAIQLKSNTQSIDSQPSSLRKNTILNVQASALKDALEVNRKQLVSQNMIENGHSKSEAESEVGSLFSILKLLDRATVDFGLDGEATLETSLYFAK